MTTIHQKHTHLTPERRADLVKQVHDAGLDGSPDLPDWALLGVRWNRNGECRADNLEFDSRGCPFTTNFILHPRDGEYTDSRGRVQVPKRDAKHFACKKCGVLVEWRKNKAGKFYLAPPMGKAPYHSCEPAWQAWYELQLNALATATAWCKDRGMEISPESLAAAVNPPTEEGNR